MPDFALDADTRSLVRFPLGQHTVELTEDADGGLALWLDGCLRKRRHPGTDGTVYLWTNVELPFEDHHLVEVRRAGEPLILEVRVNGHLQAQAERRP